MAVYATPAAKQESQTPNKTTSHFALNGFCLVAAWHFLIIHCAVFTPGSVITDGRFYWLQLVLYISLALFYGLLGTMTPSVAAILTGSNQKKRTLLLGGFSIISFAATLAVAFSSDLPFALLIVSYAALGAGTALLVFPWLITPMKVSEGLATFRNMSFNMGIGGVFAFVVTFIPHPFCQIIICLIPFVSNTVFLLSTRNEVNEEAVQADVQQEENLRLRDLMLNCVLFFLYSFIYGFCQGAFSHGTGTASVQWVLNDGWPILGAVASAVILLFVPAKYLKSHGLMTVQQSSMIFMILGVFVTLYFYMNHAQFDPQVLMVGDKAGQAIAYAGFNVFEFGFMTFAFAWAAKLGPNMTSFVGANRAMLYGGMAVGLIAGLAFHQYLGSMAGSYLLCGGIVVVALTTFCLPFITDLVPFDMWPDDEVGNFSDGKDSAEPEQSEKPEESDADAWARAVDNLATEYQLSKREREVFGYLARGRNAAFIQQELFISIHTVKTHIANIYRKLDVHSIQEVLDMIDEATHR